MTLDHQYALAGMSLVPEEDWPWEWAPEGDAIVWQDGETVVLREELALIVERLLPTGLPRFGPLVLLLAACRGKVLDESLALELLRRGAHAEPASASARAQLTALAALPPALVAGVPAKSSLAALVFSAASKMPPREAEAILALLRETIPPALWPARPSRNGLGDFHAALRELEAGLAPLDAARIEHALRTGLAEAPGAAEMELPLGESMRALLRELESDPEFRGLAGLVRDAMAAVVLPRALPQPERDAPGGFSDIGNRGSLHRLLLSELAHDDDTLAARIALGEALYLRREPAASPPPTTLALLLDAGLRMWGVPRVFGTAVALACLAKAPPAQAVSTFRAGPSDAEPVTLTTRAGLTAHLASLETVLDPGAALAALVPKLRTEDRQLDVMVITHARTLADPAFHAACLAHRDAAIHAATVDRDGNFALALATPGGWQPLATARLKLESLFSAPARAVVPGAALPLPALLRRDEPVFLLPLPRDCNATCEVFLEATRPGKTPGPDLAVAIAGDGSWWQWQPETKRGAYRAPRVRLHGEVCGLLFDGAERCVVAVGYESRDRSVHLLRRFCGPEAGATEAAQLSRPVPRPVRVWTQGGQLFLGSVRDVHVVNLRSAALVAAAALPEGMQWLNDRWLTDTPTGGQAFWSATFTGTSVAFERLPSKIGPSRRIVSLTQPRESEEIWALDGEGRLFDVETGTLKVDPGLGPLREVRVLRRGGFLVARDRGNQQHLVGLPDGTNRKLILPKAAAAPPPAWSVRNRFTHIAAYPSGRLGLRASKGYWMVLRLKEASGTFALEKVPEDATPPPSPVEFGSASAVPDHGCWLAPAVFESGARAWLDSRGMLHLQSADLFLPEISIVLAESSSLPIWCSDELLVGPPYFVGERKGDVRTAGMIDRHLRAFVANCQ